jgi:PadR family transcriptional regulator, regulatory protein AphA
MNVRTLCLGILAARPASGYEIKKDIEEGMFSHFIEASYGSIYPALTQLLNEGKLTVHAEEQSGKPDKKVYAITEDGHRALAAAVSVVPATDKFKSEFLFEMLLQEYLPAGHMLIAIDKQLGDLRADLDRIAACRLESCDMPGPAFVLDYGEAVLTASVSCLLQKRGELVAARTVLAAE